MTPSEAAKSVGPIAEKCTDEHGWVRILGFGSLLSERSARRSFPSLRDFTLVSLPGARRVFAHAAPIFFERGVAKPVAPYEFSSLTTEPWSSSREPDQAIADSAQFDVTGQDTEGLVVAGKYIAATAFFIRKDEVVHFVQREPEFAYVAVQPYSPCGKTKDGIPAVMCARGSDELLRAKLNYSEAAWHDLVGRHGIDTLWKHPPDKILPCRPYLRLCVLAAEQIGVKDNFLDSTFLADRKTSIRLYLLRENTLMTTLPQENVRKYYTP